MIDMTFFISIGDDLDNHIHAKAIEDDLKSKIYFISFSISATARKETIKYCSKINNIVNSPVQLVGTFSDEEKVLLREKFNVTLETKY